MRYVVVDSKEEVMHEGNKFSCVQALFQYRKKGFDTKDWQVRQKDDTKSLLTV